MELFKHDQTVRFVGFGTPSQRRSLWVVRFNPNLGTDQQDWGSDTVRVHRQAEPDSIIWASRKRITAATVLDLLANA